MKKLSSIDDCGPDRAFIVEGQNVQFDYTPRSSELLICFDNLSLVDRGFPRAPWLSKYAANLGYSILGVQAYTKDWYRTEPPHLNWSSAMFRKRRTDNDRRALGRPKRSQ